MKNSNTNLSAALWVAVGFLGLGLLFARAVYPELLWVTIVVAVLLVGALGVLIMQNQKALKSRSAAFGLNSAVTAVLVISIVGVVNFLAFRHPLKHDMTKNKLHTLSDQTDKLFRTLERPVKLVYFAKVTQREQIRPLVDNLKALTTKLEIEYVDPDKEPARAKQVGIKKYGTLQLVVGTKDAKIEEPNEEKVTNNLIKLLKDKSQSLCVITGHGEKNFAGVDAEGYDVVKKALADQFYDVKDVSIVQEGKIPDTCNAIAIIGPTKSFFDPEIKAIREYLASGGRAVIAVDYNVGRGGAGGSEYSPELLSVLADWHIKPVNSMVVDPISIKFGMDASVPAVGTYSKEHPITKEFQNAAFFPFARPIEIIANAPAGLNVQWLGQTTAKSWAESDISELVRGQAKLDEGKDKPGPLNAAVAVEGKLKDSKASKNTRLVVFGSSFFATNNHSRFGGNLDFFMNAASWVLEDENLISIRAKEDVAGKVELSQKQGTVIFLMTVIVIPLLVAVSGIVIWVFRRRL